MPIPHLLCILDGFGWGPHDASNAIHLANTPTWDQLLEQHPWCLLSAHGTAVGMPSDNDMGNSEVGHNAMGAGRVFDQGAKLVANAIADGTMFDSDAWSEVVARGAKGATLHLLGLVSDGNVHSHVAHLHAMIARAMNDGVRQLRLHVLTDGRDVAPRSALTWVEPLEQLLQDHCDNGLDYAIASGGGRMIITMDRYDADWPMVARGWAHHVLGQGERAATASEAIRARYAANPAVDDQWLPPFVVGDYAGMADGDAVVLFNFRGDRAIEISRAFEAGDDFKVFDRQRRPDVFFVGMMEYDGDLHIPKNTLVAPPAISGTVTSHLAAAKLRTFATSETQKYGHVTYFFNGNRSAVPTGEDRLEIPSDVIPFDQRPEMKAALIVDAVVDRMEARAFDAARINLANGDMVGHTGVLSASIKAVETLDHELSRLVATARRTGTVLLITADHGNVEEMARRDKKTGEPKLDANGQLVPSTSHSLNPVPFLLYDPTGTYKLVPPVAAPESAGSIARIGATLLTLAGLPIPSDYLPSLIERTDR